MLNERVTVVTSKRRLFEINFRELWRYRDLVTLFVKRDLKNYYKQTVLGPLWIVINPLLSTAVFTIIFGVIANISTEGVPHFLFYMSGNILWIFFSNCLQRGSGVFLGNARLFGKVYFPRLVMPVAGIIYNSVTFFIQLAVFIVLTVVYVIIGSAVRPNLLILLTPILIIQTALLGMGTGLIISSVTTKYRDLNILVSFGTTLWMYITPVVYPISQAPEAFRPLFLLNPMAPVVETFRCAFLGTGGISPVYLVISAAVTAVVVLVGIIVFNKVERTFIDTV